MDGTTAGGLGAILPIPQPQTPTGGLMMNIDHSMSTTELQSAGVPAPSVPVQPPIPQFSQLTPVYAPGPTNTRADISQPAVKGIEFVQSPTAASPAPFPTAIPPAPEPMIVAPSAPVSPSTSQLIQPILPPVSPPPIAPVSPTTALPADENVGMMSGAINYSAIENQLEDLDLDQVVGAVPPTPDFNIPAQVYVPSTVTPSAAVPTPMPAPTPVIPTIAPAAVLDQPLAKPPDAGKSYFENAYQAIAQPTAPTGKTGRKRLNLNPVLVRRILIIAGIVIVLGVGGYFGVSAILGSHKSSTATKPAVTQPTFTQPTTSTDTTTTTTPSTTTTDSSSATTTTPDTTTTAPATTTTAPAATTPAPAPTTTTPVVSNTGLEW